MPGQGVKFFASYIQLCQSTANQRLRQRDLISVVIHRLRAIQGNLGGLRCHLLVQALADKMRFGFGNVPRDRADAAQDDPCLLDRFVRAQLDNIRNKAMASLGPQPEPAAINSGQASPAPGVRAPVAPPAPQPTAPAERGGRSFDFGHGSGPVGPLFLGLLLWARRVRRKAA